MLGIGWLGSAPLVELNRVKGQMKNKKPITIKVKNFYGDAWINVVQNAYMDFYVFNKLHFSKQEAVKEFPAVVKKECRKTVKVWLVEAL